MQLRKMALGALAAVATLAAGAGANAATIVKPIIGGTFSLANPYGTIAGLKALKTNTYDFSFTTDGRYDVLTQMQASSGVARDIEFALYKGTCTVSSCTGSLIDTSALQTGPALEKILTKGSYFLQIKKITVNNEFVTGGLILSAVPEPATWSLMILGVAGMGAMLRRRQGAAFSRA